MTPRIRSIKPEAFDDPILGSVSIAARLFFIGLFTQADRRGRLRYEAPRLRVRLLPYDDGVSVDNLTTELEAAGLVRRYDQGTKVFLSILNFERHQRPNMREPESSIPSPPWETTENPSNDGTPHVHARADTCAHVHARGERERERELEREGNGNTNSARDRALTTAAQHEAFTRFWAAYPRKTNKAAAWKAWRKLDPPPELVARIMAAVRDQSAWPQWQADDGRFIPHPSTWLNQERWNDLLATTLRTSGQSPTTASQRSGERPRRRSCESTGSC